MGYVGHCPRFRRDSEGGGQILMKQTCATLHRRGHERKAVTGRWSWEGAECAAQVGRGRDDRGYVRYYGSLLRQGGDYADELFKVFSDATGNLDKVGLVRVMEQLDDTSGSAFKLIRLDQNSWRSPAGLIYNRAPANRQGHRINHVFTHTVHGWAGDLPPIHSVFSISRSELLRLLDEAWRLKTTAHPTDSVRFEMEMGRVIGTSGETKIRLVVNPNTLEVITAHPILVFSYPH